MSENIKRLVMDNISFHYNGRPNYIIHNFSMEIPSPSISTLLGLNGSGKTTLLMLMLGFYKPTHGEIYYESQQGKLPVDQINGMIGYLPQQENIPFDYTVMEFILLGCYSYIGIFASPGKDDLRKIEESMQFLDISDLADRNLSSISGGELQRVRIARLLVQNPQIILLDEPSSHLDIKSKKQIIELIDKFKQMGKIVVYSTHEPVDALNFSDYSIMMKKKETIIYGESRAIVTPEVLSDYFETKMEINEINGHRVVLVKNGIKTKISA